MSDSLSQPLETRIRVLEDIEAIKRLKSRYWRYIDDKQWEELAGCFAKEPFAEYMGPETQFRSVEAIIEYLKGDPRFETTTYHHGHMPDIEIVSDVTAKGVWAFYVNISMTRADSASALILAGFYQDEYLKEDGVWRIKNTKARVTSMETVKK